MQFFAESVCRDEAVLDLRLGTVELRGALGSVRLRSGGKTRITTKAWRHLSWTFEEAPRLAARATREHLYGTLFEEEPTFGETDLEQKSHQTKRTSFSMMTTMLMLRIPRGRAQLLRSRSVLHGGFPSRTRRTLLVSALRVRQASTETLITNCCHDDRGTECVLAACRCCARVRPLFSHHELGGGGKFSNALWQSNWTWVV